MKNYKEFGKTYIGTSDLAGLVLRGCSCDGGPELQELHFGKDAAYDAYIVDGETEIPAHYWHVATFRRWMRIYDDTQLTKTLRAERIEVYRAGEMGCIIKLIEEAQDDVD